jgi:hypothetical protein
VPIGGTLVHAGLSSTNVKSLAFFDGYLNGIAEIRFSPEVGVLLEMSPAEFLHMVSTMFTGIHLRREFSHNESNIPFLNVFTSA